MKTNILRFILPAAAAIMVCSCDLTENMQSEADRAMIFGKESGLGLYTNSFYKALPVLDKVYRQDNIIDIAAVSGLDRFITDGYTAETATSWSWGTLRNINYFIDGCHSSDCTVPAAKRDHYVGIARLFRAYFYYQKLLQYGAVPWFEHQLNPEERDIMYKDRNSRDVIIGNMIADLDFAWEHISTESSEGNSLVSKYAAAAFKSRVCLFEASFRKYHAGEEIVKGLTEYNPEALYKEAADAARKVMDSRRFSLNTAGSTPYRDLFTREKPLVNENILVICASAENNWLGSANWSYNTTTYDKMWSPVRSFVNTYLNADGSRFTDKPGYAKMTFSEEMAGRDLRLEQTVRGRDYKYDGVSTAPQLGGANLTGYHMIKFCQDGKAYESGKNTNSIPIIRYAEVLLNYAEAKAELGGGVLSQEDWDVTIGALRSRAGVNPVKPTVVDDYLQKTFYQDVTSCDILEIRRERTIELVAEGFRFNDLRRWNCGGLLVTLPWNGIHFASLDKPIDLNGDSNADVCILKPGSKAPASFGGLSVSLKQVFGSLSEITSDSFKGADGNLGAAHYAVGNEADGYDLYWFPGENRIWAADGHQYLYPVPAQEIRNYKAEGYSLSQNPGWN